MTLRAKWQHSGGLRCCEQRVRCSVTYLGAVNVAVEVVDCPQVRKGMSRLKREALGCHGCLVRIVVPSDYSDAVPIAPKFPASGECNCRRRYSVPRWRMAIARGRWVKAETAQTFESSDRVGHRQKSHGSRVLTKVPRVELKVV